MMTTHLYPDLLARARGAMRHQPADHTLQPTALANEAWLRLRRAGGAVRGVDARRVAAAALRSVLVDHARRRAARPVAERAETSPLASRACYRQTAAADLLALDEALEELARRAPARARLVELRFFGGLDVAACARELGCSTATVKREWRVARAFLHARLTGVDLR